jgi:hypothetical protein
MTKLNTPSTFLTIALRNHHFHIYIYGPENKTDPLFKERIRKKTPSLLLWLILQRLMCPNSSIVTLSLNYPSALNIRAQDPVSPIIIFPFLP